MILLVDLDGTIVNFTQPALDAVGDIWGIKMCEEDITEYKFAELVKNKLQSVQPGLGDDFSYKDIYQAIGGDEPEEFFASLPPYEGAVSAVRELSIDHQIVFLTKVIAPASKIISGKQRWLNHYFRDIEYSTIFVEKTGSKKLIMGDVIIDDDPRNLVPVNHREAICVARPWNQAFREKKVPKYNILTDFSNLSEMIDRIEEKKRKGEMRAASWRMNAQAERNTPRRYRYRS